MSDQLTVVSTFSGCGGSSLGYKLAGLNVLLAIEFDRHAAETYRLNFPNTPIIEGDIRLVNGKDVLRATGLVKGELDILDGSPPCQGFSLAGERRMLDERNNLFAEYARLARELKPKVLVMENVPGLVTGKMKLVFAAMMRELKEAGYNVEARVLNAMYYGVPQSRRRVIFIGTRKDLNIRPSHPSGTERVIPFAEAVRGLPLDTTASMKGLALELWKRTRPGRSFSDHHPKGHWFNAIKVHPGKPSPTITKTIYLGQAGIFHYRYPRMLTIPEVKRVASFPDEFQTPGSFTEQWARIGNAVPPLFMEKIAIHIRDILLSQ
jgi:DNA (cytosine-5)-methyltransferase 1